MHLGQTSFTKRFAMASLSTSSTRGSTSGARAHGYSAYFLKRLKNTEAAARKIVDLMSRPSPGCCVSKAEMVAVPQEPAMRYAAGCSPTSRDEKNCAGGKAGENLMSGQGIRKTSSTRGATQPISLHTCPKSTSTQKEAMPLQACGPIEP
jgi:hypothetical protein